LDALPLGCEPVVCLAARGHALLGASTPTLHDLRGLPLIVPQRGTPLRRTIEDLFRRRVGPNAGLTSVLETDSTTLAAQAAADGLGLAFVPQHRVPRTRDIGVLEVTGLEIELNWFLVRTRGLEEGSAVEALWDFAASADGRKLLQHLGLKSAGAFNAADVEEGAQ
jgi:DNA-binding transcriptional LysR family regulator